MVREMHPLMMRAYVQYAKELVKLGHCAHEIVYRLYKNGVNKLYYNRIFTRGELAVISQVLDEGCDYQVTPACLQGWTTLYKNKRPFSNTRNSTRMRRLRETEKEDDRRYRQLKLAERQTMQRLQGKILFCKLIRLGTDAELRTIPSGTQLLQFSGVYDVGFGDSVTLKEKIAGSIALAKVFFDCHLD